jgi:uncharacterized protein
MATTDIQGVTTATTAFVAPAPKGPLNVAVGVTSVAGFAGRFGKAAINTPLGEAVSLFFANGGRKAFVVRVPAGSPPTVADYGDPAADTGIYSLDRVKILNLLCLPAVSDDTALFDLYPSAAAYCEQRRSMLLVGLPLNASMADAQNWMRFPGATIHSRNVAAYYPSLLVSDGSGAVSRPVSCVGAVAGVFARTDSTRGVWRAATGSEANIAGVVGLAGRLTAQQVSASAPPGLTACECSPAPGR